MFNIKDGEIKIGDKLRVRQWDDMASEYGDFIWEAMRAINTPCCFVDSMKYLCGKEFEVKDIIKFGSFNHYVSSNGIEKFYNISAEMLEPISSLDEQDFDKGSDEDFFRMIGVK